MEDDKRGVQGKFIGKGSYGSVYLRESNGGRFAVKSASKNCLSSLQALENEIKILRCLSSSSPFIVNYYGDDETTSDRRLHLEYLPSGDVAKFGGITDVELIRSYTWCLAMALKEVHSKGIVHCDVKGSNVLVGPTKGVVKLCDFGSSYQVFNQHQRMKIVPRGSPLWMAPEVVRGESQGFEADIWSLGCTVIEMFTGVPAWQDNGPYTLIKIGHSDELPEYPTRLPESAKDFLSKCLVRNPEERWSCDQLLQHPFLLPVPSEFSPRSILDWQNLDFSDDDYDDDHDHDERSLSDDQEISDRIGKLATISGVSWESDGWVEVRDNSVRMVKQEEKEEKDSERTSWEYSELYEDEMVNSQDNSNDDDNNILRSINLREENDVDDGISGVNGVDRCGNGESCGGIMNTGEIEIETVVLLSIIIKYLSNFMLLIVLYASSILTNKKMLIFVNMNTLNILLLLL
ncbi:unnamed protein product, partial [Amaranthus hypochondriacus]